MSFCQKQQSLSVQTQNYCCDPFVAVKLGITVDEFSDIQVSVLFHHVEKKKNKGHSALAFLHHH